MSSKTKSVDAPTSTPIREAIVKPGPEGDLQPRLKTKSSSKPDGPPGEMGAVQWPVGEADTDIALTATPTTVVVGSVFLIDAEYMDVTDVSNIDNPKVTRGSFGSAVAAHPAGAAVNIWAPGSDTGPAGPTVCGAVPIAFYDGAHVMHTAIAHVLSVNNAIEEGQQPELTVAYPDPAVDPVILASANWQRGYLRITGVKHVSDPAVAAGQESIAWGGVVDIIDAPTMPQPAGDAVRPYFTREDDPKLAKVSVGQAAAVQSGTAPLPTTQTPLLNEPTG